MPRKLSDREEKILKQLGAWPTINSGATFGDADGWIKNRFNNYGVEIKATDAKSFSVKKETWDKVYKQTRRIGLEPVLVVDVQGTKLAVISINHFIELMEVADLYKP